MTQQEHQTSVQVGPLEASVPMTTPAEVAAVFGGPAAAEGSCVSPKPRVGDVRESLDGRERVLLISFGAGRNNFTTYAGHNCPGYSAEQVLCRWPRVVTTAPETLVMHAAGDHEIMLGNDYRARFALYDAVLNRDVDTVEQAHKVIARALGAERWERMQEAWRRIVDLPEDIRAMISPAPALVPPRPAPGQVWDMRPACGGAEDVVDSVHGDEVRFRDGWCALPEAMARGRCIGVEVSGGRVMVGDWWAEERHGPVEVLAISDRGIELRVEREVYVLPEAWFDQSLHRFTKLKGKRADPTVPPDSDTYLRSVAGCRPGESLLERVEGFASAVRQARDWIRDEVEPGRRTDAQAGRELWHALDRMLAGGAPPHEAGRLHAQVARTLGRVGDLEEQLFAERIAHAKTRAALTEVELHRDELDREVARLRAARFRVSLGRALHLVNIGVAAANAAATLAGAIVSAIRET